MPNNDVLWGIVDALANQTNCEKRSVGCVIFNKRTNQVVGRGYNWHEDGICDCDTESSSIHAEINAINGIETKYDRSDLIALINRRPCFPCHNALMRHVKEIRYTHD